MEAPGVHPGVQGSHISPFPFSPLSPQRDFADSLLESVNLARAVQNKLLLFLLSGLASVHLSGELNRHFPTNVLKITKTVFNILLWGVATGVFKKLLAETADRKNEASYFHSRCVHSKGISWESRCCLPPRKCSCFGLRWFTPASEVPLCGHATLASAAVLFYKIKNVNKTLTFATLSGELKARRAEDGIILDLPLYPAHPQDFHEVEDLIKTAIGDTLVQDICYSPDTRKLLVRLSDTYNRAFLEDLKVNTQDLPQVENSGKVKGLILTVKGEAGGQSRAFDFYSRYFAPWVGVAEDPVTGSAHTVLSSYWSQQLGKKEMHGRITLFPFPFLFASGYE
ncbi:phenazine biosynthesis-like domain-containing protein [Echinops telfairi]|uniref:Phenazine biosynthesis-like domain-containing protein n=1 Tax=Echinops telfairi TaxID=9371 RepID=A0AC55D790_ECHTE|nr:phenazine biosynthesis-like domain-containing protein [Echinops telfairi]